jgi:hypothetical protein
MKVMTCRELGGACDQKLSAPTWEENGQDHDEARNGEASRYCEDYGENA